MERLTKNIIWPALLWLAMANASYGQDFEDFLYREIVDRGDSLALVAFYEAMDGPKWEPWQWDLKKPLEEWPGVEVERVRGENDSRSFRVTALSLPFNNLKGKLPNEIGNLDQLRILRLEGNKLQSRAPESMGNLVNLELLDLRLNRGLSKSLPPALLELQNRRLRFLMIEGHEQQSRGSRGSSNQRITTTCDPACQKAALEAIYTALGGDSWTNGSKLGNQAPWDSSLDIDQWFGVYVDGSGNVIRLELDFNNLSGEIPSEIGDFPEMVRIDFSANFNISGDIDENIGNLSKLEELWLDFNQLTALPSTIGSLSNLRELVLFSNNLTSIPSTIGNLTKLTVASFSFNQLTTIPIEFGDLVNLIRVQLEFNNITSLPEGIFGPGKLTNTEEISLRYNELVSLPTDYRGLVNLERFALEYNKISQIPSQMGQLNAPITIWLYNNQITSIPPELGNIGAGNLNVNENQITSIPPELATLRGLLLRNNKLTTLPAFTADSNPNSPFEILWAQGNSCTFESIVPAANNPNLFTNSNPVFHFTYSPQAKAGSFQEVVRAVGETYQLSTEVDKNVSGVIYEWYGPNSSTNLVGSGHTLNLTDLAIADGGEYICKLTHPDAPDLILETFPINLEVRANYYSKATGDWNETTTWSSTPDGTGTVSVLPGAGDAVIIQGHTVTVPGSYAGNCRSLVVQEDGTNATELVVANTGALTIAEKAEVKDDPGNTNTCRVTINVGGQLNLPHTGGQ